MFVRTEYTIMTVRQRADMQLPARRLSKTISEKVPDSHVSYGNLAAAMVFLLEMRKMP